MSFDMIGRMEFVSKGGVKYRAEFWKRDTPGVLYDLTPAAAPFETTENNSEDPLEPVRGGTGYARFMYTGGKNSANEPWWVDFMPADATEIQVLLKNATTAAVMWQGYVKPSQYSHDYSEETQEIALPVVSALEVLYSLEMDATNVMKPATFRELLVEAVEATGLNVADFFLPYEWGTKELSTTAVATGVADFNWTAPLMTQASRFAWFEKTDAKNENDPNWREFEGVTYGEMLADWCRFWGWTVREVGDRWWFVSRRARTYCRLSKGEMKGATLVDRSPGLSTRYNAQTLTLTDAQLDGTNHTLDVTPAVRVVEVDADTQEMDRDVLAVDSKKMEYLNSAAGGIAWDDLQLSAGTTKTKALLYGPNGYPDLVAYYHFSTWGKQINWAAIASYISGPLSGVTPGVSAIGWGKADIYLESAEPDKKNYNYKEGFLIVNRGATGQTYKEKMTQPLFELRSGKSGAWRNGYFVIDPAAVIVRPGQKPSLTATGLQMQLEVGADSDGNTWRWNGSAWTTATATSATDPATGGTINVPISFAVPLTFEGGTGTVGGDINPGTTPDMKTLAMDCNGAEGYLIPITRELEGRLTLRVLAKTESDAVFLLTDLEVEYYSAEGEGQRARESVNKYYATTGAPGQETQKIALNLATDNNNNPGWGLLKYGNAVATGETYRTPLTPGDVAEVVRPETMLLATAREAYGTRRMKLQMIVTMADRERPIDRMKRGEWGDEFMPVAETISWAEDRRTLTMIAPAGTGTAKPGTTTTGGTTTGGTTDSGTTDSGTGTGGTTTGGTTDSGSTGSGGSGSGATDSGSGDNTWSGGGTGGETSGGGSGSGTGSGGTDTEDTEEWDGGDL